MKFPPTYTNTPFISESLYNLDVVKTALGFIELADQDRVTLRRSSLLQSALFSARIEGNSLTQEDLAFGIRGREKEKREIERLVLGYESIDMKLPDTITKEWLLGLHKTIGENVLVEAGHFRTEESAIYNSAGVAVYLTPAPHTVPTLLSSLCEFINSSSDDPRCMAAVSHIWFEKIHPFLDGNGRVGRLVSYAILKKHGFDFGGFVPIERYIDTHRDSYYAFLGKDTQDVTDFVDFFLKALLNQAQESLAEIKKPKKENLYNLIPRQQEIAFLINEQRGMTFNAIERRFLKVARRTLHYDLRQLQKKGIIKKLGATRGVVYVPKGE